MGIKEDGKVWKVINGNTKYKRYNSNSNNNNNNRKSCSPSSNKTIKYTRKIIPLVVDDALNVIDRNIIIQRHNVFQKETKNEYDHNKLNEHFELLFKNDKDYIQRKNTTLTDSAIQIRKHYINNNNNTNNKLNIKHHLPNVNNDNNYCNTSYHKQSKYKSFLKTYNIDKVNKVKDIMCCSYRGSSIDNVELALIDNDIQQSNEHYLKSRLLCKLKKKFPFYKRNNETSTVQLDRSNNYNLYKQHIRKTKTNSNCIKLMVNDNINSNYSMNNVSRNEMYMRHKKYSDEVYQYFRDGSCGKRFNAFKNRIKRIYYNNMDNNNNNSSSSNQSSLQNINVVHRNKLNLFKPKIKHIFIRNKNTCNNKMVTFNN